MGRVIIPIFNNLAWGAKRSKLIVCLSIMFFVFIVAEARAQVSYENEKTEVLKNDCKVTGKNCDLREFSIKTFKTSVLFPDDARVVGTTIIAWFETKSEASLKNYVLVQYIKGCLFESRLMSDGTVEKTSPFIKQNFDVKKPFHFPHWIIDSLDTDPALGSYNNNRFYFFTRLFPRLGGAPATRFYTSEKVKYPRLYIIDAPTRALFKPQGSSWNASLEFKICIYKASDVPRKANETDAIPMPIHCLRWSSSHIVDHALNTVETRQGIDPFCETELTR